MSMSRILAGLVLIAAMGIGLLVWLINQSFVAGAATFVVGAIAAGMLHNGGDRKLAAAQRTP